MWNLPYRRASSVPGIAFENLPKRIACCDRI